jgi:DNA-binding NtrC family response regulator
MTALRILLIDDDPALLQALPEALQIRMGAVTVDTAESAAAALDRIAARDYDAIITDIKMPRIDGIALLAEIRTRRPDTPILMITGHGGHTVAIQALRGGAYDFIEKPIDRDYVVASLRRAIQARAASRRVKDREFAMRRCASELEQIAARLRCQQPRVLIVDDDAALLQALPEALRIRMAGVTVDTAGSAAAALDQIALQDYDAIVTDIKMPGMDGLALLAEVRARLPDTPILVITGHGEYELSVRALRSGAYDFIQKPIDRDHFVASLDQAIRVRALSRRVKSRQSALQRCAGELESVVEKLARELRAMPTRGNP